MGKEDEDAKKRAARDATVRRLLDAQRERDGADDPLGDDPFYDNDLDDPFSQASLDAENSDGIQGDKAVETSVALNESGNGTTAPEMLRSDGDTMAQYETKLKAEDDFRSETKSNAREQFRDTVAAGGDRDEAGRVRLEQLNVAQRNTSYEYWIPPGRSAGSPPAIRRKPNWNPERDQVVEDRKYY